MSAKPHVKTRCVANSYAAANERIVEFGDGENGGLISFRSLDDGTLRVELYRLDSGVRVLSEAAK